MMLSIVLFKKEMVLIIWSIFMIFALIKPLEMLTMDIKLFKTFDWLIWLSIISECLVSLT